MTDETAHPSSNLLSRLRDVGRARGVELYHTLASEAADEIERLTARVEFLEGMGPHPFTPTSLPPQRGLCHECGLERSARMHICRPDDHLYAAKAGSPIGDGVCIKCGAQEPSDETTPVLPCPHKTIVLLRDHEDCIVGAKCPSCEWYAYE